MVYDLVSTATVEAARELDLGATLALDASLDTRRAWDAARRRHHPGGRDGKGYADGTQHALAVCRGFTLRCAVCGSLVHWMAARTRARKAKRVHFMPGDGCSGRSCSLNFRPGQHKAGQRKMAHALSTGARRLIAWLPSLDARIVNVLPRTDALAAGPSTPLLP